MSEMQEVPNHERELTVELAKLYQKVKEVSECTLVSAAQLMVWEGSCSIQ